MTPEEWEGLCDGCGKCCEIPKTGFACPALDTCTNKCTAYKNRFETHHCLKVRPCNVRHLHSIGVLPDTCAYVRLLQGLEPLEKVEPAKLTPFCIAGEKVQKAYNKVREQWFDLWRDKEPYQ